MEVLSVIALAVGTLIGGFVAYRAGREPGTHGAATGRLRALAAFAGILVTMSLVLAAIEAEYLVVIIALLVAAALVALLPMLGFGDSGGRDAPV